ncbi:MAG TPA: PQQ-binding-like beta-propeller repeat protein [Verrucomicrobiae bacterium]|nr:PQQ-binding-like beta-propeller repeat protein [Verrucomicrobiae bacterium]
MNDLRIIAAIIALCSVAAAARGEDWPQWRGLHRDGVWHETGILESFPSGGPKVLWRIPVGTGFSSPIVAQGKVYVTDSHVTRTNARENVRCLDAATGKTNWVHTYDVVYPEYGADPDHPFGPAATPVVADGKVYTFGRMCDLLCLDAVTGRVLWRHELPKEYGTAEDLRGFNSSPIIEGNLVIIAIARSPQISVVAFDKDSGRQVWEALDEIPSNTSPIVIDSAGRRQLIVWAYKSVTALDPRTGRILWRQSVPPAGNYAVSTPAWKDDLLLLSGLMLKLYGDKPGVSVLWPDEMRPLRIYVSDTSTPLLQDGLVFSPTSKGQLLCLDAATGKQLWQADQVSESKSGASIHMTAVPGIRCVFLFTDRGDLILARLTAAGYQELGRFHLLDPTADYGERKMAWVPPAYSGQRVFARNDKELVCVSLAATPTNAPVE